MPNRPLVAVTDYMSEAEIEKQVLADVADVQVLNTSDETVLTEQASEAAVLLVFHIIELTDRSISRLDRLQGIVRVGVGYDNVDLASAGRHGVVVCNVPDYGTEEVADHALMLLLAMTRRLVPAHDAIRAGQWDPKIAFGAPRLRGKTLGLIGCGRIGSAMALRAKALGMRVVFYDPYKPPGYEKALGVERCDRLHDLLPQSEFVSLHTPLTDETRRILNAETIGLLPRGAYLVNTARGPCVHADALLDAVESGRIAYAALDVIEREPLQDERLRRHPRILLTPHTAFYSAEGYVEMRTKAALEAKRILTGEPVLNPVNRHVLINPRCVLPPPVPTDAVS